MFDIVKDCCCLRADWPAAALFEFALCHVSRDHRSLDGSRLLCFDAIMMSSAPASHDPCGSPSALDAQTTLIRLYELLKNDNRSADRTGKRARRLQRACLSNAHVTNMRGRVVEVNGIEPMTPCLQSRCSPS